MTHPLDMWGEVLSPPRAEPDLQRVRIEKTRAGFQVIVVESSGVFDFWLEREEEVADYLRSMEVDWHVEPHEAVSGTQARVSAGQPEADSKVTDSAALLQGLSSNDVMVRRKSLHLIVQQPAKARPLLIQLLLDEQAVVIARVWAAMGLGHLGADESGQVEGALSAALEADDPTLRWATLRTIGGLRLRSLAPLVARFVDDSATVRGTWDDLTPADAAKATLRQLAEGE